MVNGKKHPKVGDLVHVWWGVDNPVAARVLEVWDDPPTHVRVQLMMQDTEEEPIIILIRSSSLIEAA